MTPMNPTVTEEDRALKAAHRAMWALGDYPALADELIPDLGRALVAACGLGPGDRVLDVATGSGNAALPAARLGAQVVAADLTPDLLAAGELRAAAAGVQVEWREADAESLPFPDDSFDAVMSCLGVMFAPHHRTCADELLRVCRPGGTIGLISWTSEGFIGQMFAAMQPYAPPPAPGAQSPLRWGDERHVRELFHGRADDIVARRHTVRVDRYSRPEDFRDDFKYHYGPTVAAYQRLADQPDRVAALDDDLAALARRHGLGVDTTAMEWEYLLVTARAKG